jgi:SAM-dependent methyltransferase
MKSSEKKFKMLTKNNPRIFIEKAVLGNSKESDCCYDCDKDLPKGTLCVTVTNFAPDVSYYGRRYKTHICQDCYASHGFYPPVANMANPVNRKEFKKGWTWGAEPVAAIPGEPIEFYKADEYLENGQAALFETEDGKYYIMRANGAYVYNPETRSALFKTAETAKEAYRKTLPNPVKKPKADKRPARFRKMADALQKQIDSKRHPAIADQNLTRRRAHIAESMAHDADNLERIQHILRGMADEADAGRLPLVLQGIKNKAQIQAILWQWKTSPSLKGMSEQDIASAKEMMDGYIKGPSEEVKADQAKRKMEADLIGSRMPGFFPSPPAVVQRLVELSKPLYPALKYLEPSAGKGDIADAMKWAYGRADMNLTLVELSSQLVDILKLKGYQPVHQDFMTFNTGTYDRIIMNPPFEHGQDVDHVYHAYELLAPGGRLVSVMGLHPFFGSDKKSVEFRLWLNSVDGTVEDLPQGSFTGKASFRQTGTNGKIVVINKPGVKGIKAGADEAYRKTTEMINAALADGKEHYITPQYRINLSGKDHLINTSGILHTLGAVEGPTGLNYWQLTTPAAKKNPALVTECKEIIKKPTRSLSITNGNNIKNTTGLCFYCHKEVETGTRCISFRLIQHTVYRHTETYYAHIPCWQAHGEWPPLYQPHGDTRHPRPGTDQGKLINPMTDKLLAELETITAGTIWKPYGIQYRTDMILRDENGAQSAMTVAPYWRTWREYDDEKQAVSDLTDFLKNDLALNRLGKYPWKQVRMIYNPPNVSLWGEWPTPKDAADWLIDREDIHG